MENRCNILWALQAILGRLMEEQSNYLLALQVADTGVRLVTVVHLILDI